MVVVGQFEETAAEVVMHGQARCHGGVVTRHSHVMSSFSDELRHSDAAKP